MPSNKIDFLPIQIRRILFDHCVMTIIKGAEERQSINEKIMNAYGSTLFLLYFNTVQDNFHKHATIMSLFNTVDNIISNEVGVPCADEIYHPH